MLRIQIIGEYIYCIRISSIVCLKFSLLYLCSFNIKKMRRFQTVKYIEVWQLEKCLNALFSKKTTIPLVRFSPYRSLSLKLVPQNSENILQSSWMEMKVYTFFFFLLQSACKSLGLIFAEVWPDIEVLLNMSYRLGKPSWITAIYSFACVNYS